MWSRDFNHNLNSTEKKMIKEQKRNYKKHIAVELNGETRTTIDLFRTR